MCDSLCLIQSLVRCPLDFRIILQNLKSIGPIVWSQSPKMHFCKIPRRTPHHDITDVISLQICLNTTSVHWHGLSFQFCHFISPILLLGEFEKIAKYIDRYRLYICLSVRMFVCLSLCLSVSKLEATILIQCLWKCSHIFVIVISRFYQLLEVKGQTPRSRSRFQ